MKPSTRPTVPDTASSVPPTIFSPFQMPPMIRPTAPKPMNWPMAKRIACPIGLDTILSKKPRIVLSIDRKSLIEWRNPASTGATS
jgi:hypothetical protein